MNLSRACATPLQKALDTQENTVERHSCTSYLASFIARCATFRHVSSAFKRCTGCFTLSRGLVLAAVSWFEVLLQWSHEYMALHMQSRRRAVEEALKKERRSPKEISEQMCAAPPSARASS